MRVTIRPLLATCVGILVAIVFLAATSIEYAPGVRAAPPASVATSSPCTSFWYVSYGGTTTWTLINTDTEGLPLSDLRFSRSYNDPTDLSKGYLDFNRDGKSDVFSAVPLGGGLYQWRYSSGAKSPWLNLAYDDTPPDQLRFGDFNGDGYTDVFSAVPSGLVYQWRYSPGGTAAWVNLAADTTPPDQLRFGDFNGDGRTDVFALIDLGNGYLGWNVSYSGTTNYVQINSATTPLSEMQFGDIDRDGHTDVFTTISNTTFGYWEWLYSPAGSGAYKTIDLSDLSVHDVGLAGDFNGDQRSDYFWTSKRLDGSNQWWYEYYVPNVSFGGNQLAYDTTPPDQLRFGDFNGDGITDVFKLTRQCMTYLPVIKR